MLPENSLPDGDHSITLSEKGDRFTSWPGLSWSARAGNAATSGRGRAGRDGTGPPVATQASARATPSDCHDPEVGGGSIFPICFSRRSHFP